MVTGFFVGFIVWFVLIVSAVVYTVWCTPAHLVEHIRWDYPKMRMWFILVVGASTTIGYFVS